FVKIPMQAFILYVGVLLFVYHLFVQAPVFMNEGAWEKLEGPEPTAVERRYDDAFEARKSAAFAFLDARGTPQETSAREALSASDAELQGAREEAKALLKARGFEDTEDADYVFVRFVLDALPSGIVGLLIAVILSAAMSSTASELNALGTTTTVDFWQRLGGGGADDRRKLLASKLFTAGWGLVALAFASFASLFDNLIEAVNVLGSIFYGTVLGIFVVAFFLPRVGGRAVFAGAVAGQAAVLALFVFSKLGFLWYNVVGCLVVAGVSAIAQPLFGDPPRSATEG
ncbi:MAG: sodium:solute symporter, partial [Myxococcota bacterium]